MTINLNLDLFRPEFTRFKRVLAANDQGRPFTSFREGVADAWEGYKPRLRDYANGILAAETWTEVGIGSGNILRCVTNAIEIQQGKSGHNNNLVRWQNRFGHANRDHRVLLEAISDPALCRDLEDSLFGLYRRKADEGALFERLRALVGPRYPLLAYLFFLKDINRFMPIGPTAFDRAFRDLAIDLTTRGQCSWDNYQRFNATLGKVQAALASSMGRSDVRLIDAHSFCWMLVKMEESPGVATKRPPLAAGHVFNGWEKSIVEMRMNIEKTVKNANSQTVERTVKNKELRMTPLALEKLLESLIERQEKRCNLTGIPFQLRSPDSDHELMPSPDRIDSNGHYEAGNIQIVCRFINVWKSDTDNETFKRLLALVRGLDPDE